MPEFDFNNCEHSDHDWNYASFYECLCCNGCNDCMDSKYYNTHNDGIDNNYV